MGTMGTLSLVTEASPSLKDVTLCRCVPRQGVGVPSPAGCQASLTDTRHTPHMPGAVQGPANKLLAPPAKPG